MINIRTDLALEAKEMYNERMQTTLPPGVESQETIKDGILITKVEIKTAEGTKNLNKPIGTYITIESPKIKNMDPDVSEDVSFILKEQLQSLINTTQNENVLIVGLGNWNITPDALGPKVISQVMVTKHLLKYIPEHIDKNLRPVSAISPGVLGITGVETGDIVSGIVRKTKPSLIIAIDALASKSPERISSTIQLSDTGINPGSGVGNKREGLNKETLGVPVIAIGVPTVVDAVSIASDLINELCDSILNSADKNSDVYSMVDKLKENGQEELLRSVLKDEKKELMVTPKEVDNIITHLSKVISNGINLALHKDIDLEYIENFMF